MRALALLSLLLLAGGRGPLTANGVTVTAPAGWHRVAALQPANVADPATVLVAGTAGVRPHATSCQIASYAVPRNGAVVVVVRWKRGRLPSTAPTHDDRSELARLTTVRRPSFECFRGRGASAQVALGGHVFQIDVMVGDDASSRAVADALSVARSFRLTR